jgi:TusA-related sulfurtransferase
MMDAQLNHKIKQHLDLRNAVHPLALLMAKKAFLDIFPGEMLEVLIGDPETRADLFKVLSDIAYEVIQENEFRREESFYRIRIRKKGASHQTLSKSEEMISAGKNRRISAEHGSRAFQCSCNSK